MCLLGFSIFQRGHADFGSKGCLIASCINGIDCLCGNYYFGDNDIVLWNIAMRGIKVVPSCPIDCAAYSYLDYEVERLGFGYDDKTKDYMVVRMVYF